MRRIGTASLLAACVAAHGVAAAQSATRTGNDDSGTLTPAGPPSRPPVRMPAGTGCVVEITQTYLVSGDLEGTIGIDYRILIHGPCGGPPGTFDEEWIAVGTFDGTVRERQATGTFSYTATVAAGGHVDGRLVFGHGITGELAVGGNFDDGRLSYHGLVAPEDPTPASPPGIRLLHLRYMTASIRHDLPTLRRLTHEDVVWRLGPRTLTGRDEVLGPNEYDAGVHNQLQYRNVVVRHDTVETEVVERNGIIRAVGMTEVHSFPRYVFEGGLLVRKEPWRPSRDLAELQARSEPLRRWIRAHHPETLEILVDGSGRFRFSEASGALMVRLAREWEEAGAPGRRRQR